MWKSFFKNKQRRKVAKIHKNANKIHKKLCELQMEKLSFQTIRGIL